MANEKHGQRTEEELTELRQSWKNDPCWDIESTEGFEAHRDELKAFSDQCNSEWRLQAERRKEKEEKMLNEELEAIGNIGLLRMIKSLKTRLDTAENRITELNELLITRSN